MRLTVSHTTSYHFSPPRARVIQSLRMTPVSTRCQKVESWAVTCEGGSLGARFTDGAGDVVTTLAHPGPVQDMEIAVKGVVDTTDTAGVLRGHREITAPSVYLRKTRMTAPGMGLLDLAQKVASIGDGLERAHALSAAITAAVVYTPGATDQGMTAAEALEMGRGVCQDHAQVLIATARILKMPARYVTGYLMTDAEGNAHEASHAWAEVYIPDLGWVGLDPANGCSPDARYIRVGSGMDALDAAPIRGISLGGGDESMDIQVSVAAQQ